MSKKQENIGVIFVLSGSMMWGAFPVLVNRGTQFIHPVMFAALTTLLASCGSFAYAALKGDLHELADKKILFLPDNDHTLCSYRPLSIVLYWFAAH